MSEQMTNIVNISWSINGEKPERSPRRHTQGHGHDITPTGNPHSSQMRSMFDQTSSSLKEETSNKMTERGMIGQVTINPFLSSIPNITIQDTYLKPMNSSFLREQQQNYFN